MRKISKISLVAAVAVAGFSTANAQPLEQAIKDVEVSGSVVYRYDNFDDSKRNGLSGTTAGESKTDLNRYKIGLNLSSKVNDYVKFNSRFIVGSQANGGFETLNAGKENNTDNVQGADGQADVSLSNAYFGFTAIPNTVVNIGKQGLTTPYTVATDINGNEQNGTGILALTSIDAITAGAGYFNNQNLDKSGDVTVFDGGSDVYVATLQGDLDFVKLEAWYLGVQDSLNSYTLAATGNIDLAENAKIGLEARYVNLKLDNDLVAASSDARKNEMFRFAVDGKFDIVNARVAYTRTGDHGGITATDQDAKNTSLGWALTSLAKADADYWQAALGADILDNLNFTVHYGNLRAKGETPVGVANTSDLKQEEVYGQLTYKMSKNLSTYLRYGNVTSEGYASGVETRDENRGRIQVAYTF